MSTNHEQRKNDWILYENFQTDTPKILNIGTTKHGKLLNVVFKDRKPHILATRIIKGKPAQYVNQEPFKYSKVQPRGDSNFHEEFMYYYQAIFDLYENVSAVDLTSDEGEFEFLKFTLDDGTIKKHIVVRFRNDKGDYSIVSRDPWE